MVDFVDIKGHDIIGLRLVRLRKGLEDVTSLMGEIGNWFVTDILIRTAKGTDVKGLPFQPYSESYKRVREDKGLPTNKVDLFFTGQMTSALTYEQAKDQVRLFFMDTPRRGTPKKGGGFSKSEASNAQIAFYNNEVRKFFAISPEERKTVLKMVREYVENLLKK